MRACLQVGKRVIRLCPLECPVGDASKVWANALMLWAIQSMYNCCRSAGA